MNMPGNASLIAAALDALQRAIDATEAGSVGYEEAEKLLHRATMLWGRIEEKLVILAKDRPDAFGDYEDEE